MWTKYSMLRATLIVHKQIDISKYGKLILDLKAESRNYKSKKAKILERTQIEEFLKEAPDKEYLQIKVATILGVAGACRCNELTFLDINNVQDKGSYYLYIHIPNTKTNVSRSFAIVEEAFGVNGVEMCRKYIDHPWIPLGVGGGSMLGSPAGPGGASQRGIWPLAPAPAPTSTSFTTDGFSKCGVYSLFPAGTPSFGSALYSHARTIGQFTSGHIQQSGNPFHHKDSLFSPTGYMFGSPTPPPGSPYSPVPATQLDFLAKGFNSNIIIQQQQQPPLFDFPPSPTKKLQDIKRCDEKCCSNLNKQQQKPCINCQTEGGVSPKKIYISESNNISTGCSRTNPLDWSSGLVNVKKEPGSNPCQVQVAEITTSVTSPSLIKLEMTSPKNGLNGNDHQAMMHNVVSNSGLSASANIPVGIAVARQKLHHQEVIGSPSLPPVGLLTTVNAAAQIKDVARISEIEPSSTSTGMAAGTTGGGGAMGGSLLQCTDDRAASLAGWPMGGTHGSTLATPTLWQYPASVPMEPMVPLPVPMTPGGFQLVRDPTTGGLLLLPTTGIESLQQAVVWPGYHQPPSVLLPPLQPPPLQLLSSASSDYLSSSTTLHQHTQTHHSTRLVAITDNKRKIPLPIPATTLIKIETDAAALEHQAKALQAMSTIASGTGTVFADPSFTHPLLTTHVIYQHPTTNHLILSQPPQQPPQTETVCRSQATSPAYLTPPPEIFSQDQFQTPIQQNSVQDASNQTDNPEEIEIDIKEPSTPIAAELLTPEIVLPEPEPEIQSASNPSVPDEEPQPTSQTQPEEIEPPSRSPKSPSVEPPNAVVTTTTEPQPDISGLELLSNSIVEFERNVKVENYTAEVEVVEHPKVEQQESGKVDDLSGLGLLCEVAEQRIAEESSTIPKAQKSSKKKRKNKKHDRDEPRRKKSKSDDHHRKRCQCFRSYKTPESEEEAKRFLASKTQPNDDDFPCMNENELDMRMKLADLQRQYREKQKELSKLKPKTCKKRKKSTQSERSPTPPPLLDRIEVYPKATKELLRPPTLAVETTPMKHSDRIINNYKNDLLRQQAMEEEHSPEKNSSKRKVGRPKKLVQLVQVQTETIVAKKPKNIVGYLLAAKEKLQRRLIFEESTKFKQNKNNNDVPCKIRPKLKAEPKVKVYEEEEEWEEPEEEEEEVVVEAEPEEEEEEVDVEPEEQSFEPEVEEEEEEEGAVKEPEPEEVKMNEEKVEHVEDKKDECTLTAEHLEVDKKRVLMKMGGLFYAGCLNAIEPPDVYSITLDGERGNKPHIMSREEILRDAICEVAPKNIEELSVGTRLCAYWSHNYRCLYPGSVAEPGSPDPNLNSQFVAVEFDDGDSGTIDIKDIRLLPPDFIVCEYDPNPLQTLSKRRRRASTSVSTDERRHNSVSSLASSSPPSSVPTEEDDVRRKSLDMDVEKENKDVNKPPDAADLQAQQHHHNKERKRLKKRKREKQKQKLLMLKNLSNNNNNNNNNNNDKKMKKRKHKCSDEFCKHKKHHKKHRKHKKHHHHGGAVLAAAAVASAAEAFVENKAVIAEEPMLEDEVSNMEEEFSKSEDVFDEESMVEPEPVPNPEDEVTMDDILEAVQVKKSKKIRDRQESSESRSMMSAFLPARQLWGWSGKGYRRPKAKGKARKQFFKSIQRGDESITVGDSAVFLSTGRPDRPFIGKIEAMWETCSKMEVKVKWFYHPEETVGCPLNLQFPGALFESPHMDENDVQTISHKCEVLPLMEYRKRLGDDPQRYESIYEANENYYLAGSYDPISKVLKIRPEIPFKKAD